jgi:hypothetical protein
MKDRGTQLLENYWYRKENIYAILGVILPTAPTDKTQNIYVILRAHKNKLVEGIPPFFFFFFSTLVQIVPYVS